MPTLASRTGLVSGEGAFEVLAQVKELQARGRRVFNFAIGEPDFPTPEPIRGAAVAAIEAGETRYSPSPGLWALREALARFAGRQRGVRLTPEQVVVTPGAKPVIFHTLLALVDPGDEVVYPNPGFPTYESVIRFAGGRPVPARLVEEKGFALDLDDLCRKVNERTRLIILNSPHNPTGGMLSRDDLLVVAELARRYDCWVLSDEVYSRLVYEGEFCSIASLPGMLERTIVVDGFSKTYAMTGWRLGFGVAPLELAGDLTRMVINAESCTATFTQYAGLEALKGPQEAPAAMLAELRARRNMMVEGLNAIPGVRCQRPPGAFYVYPNVTELCRRLGLPDARALQQKLLYEGNVAVLARTAFGSRHEGEEQEYLRLSYATSRERIAEGLRRIRAIAGEGAPDRAVRQPA